MDPTAAYIAGFLALDNPQLDRLAREEEGRSDIQPSVGLEAGKLLGLLVRLTRAQRVLELGSCLGYSAIWLGQALRTTGGRLVSVEYDEGLFREASDNIAAAGLADIVEMIRGDAQLVIEQLQGPFDLVLQDSSKPLYPLLLERCIALTRQFGLLVADDALFKPRGIRAELSEPVDEYNRRVFADERLYSTILPIGDGVTLSVKLSD